MEPAEIQLLTQTPEVLAVSEASDPGVQQKLPRPQVQGMRLPSGLSPSKKQLDMFFAQKCMPLVVKFWMLSIALYVYSYIFKYNL